MVTRFGRYVAHDACPASRVHIPWPIEARQIVNVESVEGFSDQTRMLTSDENLVDINFAVQYRRAEPVEYAFNVRDPGGHARRGQRERDPRDRRAQPARLRARGRAGRKSPRARRNWCSARSTRTTTGIEVTTVNLSGRQRSRAGADVAARRDQGARGQGAARARGAGLRQRHPAQGARLGRRARSRMRRRTGRASSRTPRARRRASRSCSPRTSARPA